MEISKPRTRSSRSRTRCRASFPSRRTSPSERLRPQPSPSRCRAPHAESVGAPDYFAPTVGWRGWLVVRVEGAAARRATGRSGSRGARCGPLPARGGALVAGPPLPTGHAAPDEGCRCGIYAATSARAGGRLRYRPTQAARAIVHRVIGRVSLLGTVVACTRGSRAERAYAASPAVPTPARRRPRGTSSARAAWRLSRCQPRRSRTRSASTVSRRRWFHGSPMRPAIGSLRGRAAGPLVDVGQRVGRSPRAERSPSEWAAAHIGVGGTVSPRRG
jgi:hypothetical protein